MTPNTIEFSSTSDNTWVMRITADRKIEVNEDVDVTFAAQKVLDAMQGLLTPQRTWVELTTDDIASICLNQHPLDGIVSFAKELDAKLRSKNSA